MLKSVLLGVLMICSMSVAAQNVLLAQGSAPDLYLVHTVKKGETWYSLGRAYGLSPKDIAARNNMQMDNGLALGAQITIPLNSGNFVQSKDASSDGGLRPVYHHVGDKETLYRISLRYGKVPLDNVRAWNNFSGDGVKKDAMLIVGYVKGTSNSIVQAAPPVGETAAQTAPVTTTPPPATTAQTAPPATTPPPANTTQTAPVTTTPPAATTTQTAPPATGTTPPASTPVPETAAQTTPPADTPAATVEEQKQTEPSSSLGRTPVIPAGGFEQAYMQQTNNGEDVVVEKGPGTWFRSNAIVGSGKYYALHNSAPRGTIVKVTNPLTGQSIYAKVLDAIPQLKANANLIIKLSDAAQQALGITQGRFYCELRYDEK